MVGAGGRAIRCCSCRDRSKWKNVDRKSVIITIIVSNSETTLSVKQTDGGCWFTSLEILFYTKIIHSHHPKDSNKKYILENLASKL